MILELLNNKLFGIFLVVVITLYKAYQQGKLKLLKKLFTNASWVINLAIVIIFSSYMIHTSGNDLNGKRIKDAIKKGILALIVAIIAQLDLTIAPFWIVFTLAVSFEGYV